MTENDLRYLHRLLNDKVIKGPVLELGAGYGGRTCRDAIRSATLKYFASDIVLSTGVDFVADFESTQSVKSVFGDLRFGCVLILNVLEHTFDPISILDNAMSLLTETGSLVVITPAVWSLHDYPIDCYRLLPNFYEQYAARRELVINQNYFEYVEMGKVRDNIGPDGKYRFPLPARGKYRYWRSRVVQKLFNTYGRAMAFPSHVAIGAVFERA